MTAILTRFKGAFLTHFRSWSLIWEVGACAVCVLLLVRNLPLMSAPGPAMHQNPEPHKDVALYLCVLALFVSSLVAYRRSNALRAEGAWTNVAEATDHSALLTGELLCSVLVSALYCIPPIVYVAFANPSALAPSMQDFLVLSAAMGLIIAIATAVFYLLSAYVLGAEGFSVLAIAIVILGFSRSDVPREVARAAAKLPATADLGLDNVASIVVRVVTPPIEELIRAALDGTFAGRTAFILQAVLQVGLAVLLSYYVVSKWGSYDWRERRRKAV